MKRIMIVLLSIVLVFSATTAIYADSTTTQISDNQGIQKMIVNYVVNQVKETYEKDYKITQISGKVLDFSQDGSNIKASVLVSMKRVLLEKSADDLMYVKGLESARDSLTDKDAKEKANSYIDSLKEDLNDNYIGVEQEENDVFDVTISKGNLTRADFSSNSNEASPIQLEYETMTGQCSMKDFEVPKSTELFSNGEKAIGELLSSNNVPLAQNYTRAQELDREAAAVYARRYTNNSLRTNDDSCYNHAYNNYMPDDCANYVSQCLKAGGLSTDQKWSPYTYAWINHYGLPSYMESHGIMFTTRNKYKACAGSIMYFLDQHHVAIVDQNDTKRMTYCSHTKNRRSSSFASSRFDPVKFYVPVWDSVNGRWTPQ